MKTVKKGSQLQLDRFHGTEGQPRTHANNQNLSEILESAEYMQQVDSLIYSTDVSTWALEIRIGVSSTQPSQTTNATC